MSTSRSRRTLATTAVALAALVVAACGSTAPAGGGLAADAPLPTDVPAGTTLVIADQAEAQQVALRASGELSKLPFTAQFANFTGGPAILEAFRAGAADVATVGDTPPIQALAAGEDVPIILARQTDPSSTQLAVTPGKNIRKLADLRGAKIAYAEGTAQQVIVLRALEKAGYIQGYHAELDAKALGFEVSGFVFVGLASQHDADLKRFEEKVRSWPEVRECHMLSGEVDFLLKCVATDLSAFQTFITETLTAEKNVASVKSSLVIHATKHEPGVPLEIRG